MMNPEQLEFGASAAQRRADQIFNAFARFHSENPKVWELFERFTLEAVTAGREFYSSNAIFERIRWHVDIETSGGEVKLNNNFRAYYARLFHARHPRMGQFFRNRKRTSEDESASETDIQVFIGANPGDETELMRKLAAL